MSPFLQVQSLSGPLSSLSTAAPSADADPGQVVFTTPGTTNWTVPSGVTAKPSDGNE